MVTKLRLEIHRITLLKKSDKEYKRSNFGEFFESINSEKDKAFSELWLGFVESFGSKFSINKEGDRAITATSGCRCSIISQKNIINGEVKGGPTNRQQHIYNQDDSENSTGVVNNNDVLSSKFFIKLWLPWDYTDGILMIQSYSNSNISELIRLHLKDFFRSVNCDYKVLLTSYYPKSIQEKRNMNSNVVSVIYVKDKISKGSRKLINPLFAEFDNLKVRIEISGFNSPVSEFWNKFMHNGKVLNTDIKAFEMNASDENFVIATYKDADGYTTKMNLDKKRLRDFAYYTLPVEIMSQTDNTYDFEKITEHTNDILRSIQNEIGY